MKELQKCAKTLPNTKTITQMKSVYSGKSNILLTHCGLFFNPPPSPLKFTYISFKQPVACQMTRKLCTTNKIIFVKLWQMTQIWIIKLQLSIWKLFKNVEVQNVLFNTARDGICKYPPYRSYPITNILHQFQDMQMPEKSNIMTRESGHGIMVLTILTPHTHLTPPTSCDENEQSKEQK